MSRSTSGPSDASAGGSGDSTASPLSHIGDGENFPSADAVRAAADAARARFAAEGLDADTSARLEKRLEEICAFGMGRYLLVNGGGNGYWTDVLATHEAKAGADAYANDVEALMLRDSNLRRLVQPTLYEQVAPLLRPGAKVASVPCGLMSEVLLSKEGFKDVQFTALDIDEANFEQIRAKYSKQLEGNEFRSLKQDALKLELEQQFDLVTCVGFVMYLKDESELQALFAGIHRALRSGGRLVTNFFPTPGERSALWAREMAPQMQLIVDIAKCIPLRFSKGWSTSAIVEALSKTGFERVTIIGDRIYGYPTVVAHKAN